MVGEIRLRTRSPEETRGVGAAIANLLLPGDVVSLTGDLGAGKTNLVQGAARALGVTEQVSSPTFVLVREYHGLLPIHHLDIYRLDRVQDVLDLGFEDLLDPRGVMFVEWGSGIEGLLPEAHLEVELHAGEGEQDRDLAIRGRGRSWAERWDRLDHELGKAA